MYPPFDRPLSPTSSRKNLFLPNFLTPTTPAKKYASLYETNPRMALSKKKKPVPRPSSKTLELVSLIYQPRGEKKKRRKTRIKKSQSQKRERETLLSLLPPPSIEDDGSKASVKRSVEIFSPLRVRRNSYLAPPPRSLLWANQTIMFFHLEPWPVALPFLDPPPPSFGGGSPRGPSLRLEAKAPFFFQGEEGEKLVFLAFLLLLLLFLLLLLRSHFLWARRREGNKNLT